ncbi:MAG: protein kinase [Anaerolineae bacterium]
MEDLTGKQLGPYQIITPLGRGGMAAVYKAYQPSMERYVALKILPRHYASDPEFIGRFTQEARVIANLQHPHILPVHDFGEADGYTYLTMRFVEGGTLADWLADKQPLSFARIRRIIAQVGSALDYAHTQGVIHRDIKPSNILVDEWENYLLTDFGLAKMVESTSQFTQTGGIVGTPAYMSPEQGLGTPIDSRSDIYSLGVVLYQMAVGQLPYQAETPMAIVIKHIHDPLPPPRQFRPDLPEPIEGVILKSLAKEPDDRFTRVNDLVEALQKAIDAADTMPRIEMPTLTAVPAEGSAPGRTEPAAGQPLADSAPPILPTLDSSPAVPETALHPRPRKRKRRWLFPLIGLLGLCLLGFLAFSVISSINDPGGGTNGSGANSQPGADLPDSVRNLVQEANTARDAGDPARALALLDEAFASPDAPGWLRCERGEIALDLDQLSEARDDFETCLSTVDDPFWQARGAAVINMVAGHEAMANEDNETALVHFQKWAELEPNAAWPHCSMGMANDNLGRFDPAIAEFEQCLALATIEDVANFAASGTYFAKAHQAKAIEDWAAAEDLFSQAIERTPEAWLFCERGEVRLHLGVPGEARQDFQDCLDLAGDDASIRDWAEQSLRDLDASTPNEDEIRLI